MKKTVFTAKDAAKIRRQTELVFASGMKQVLKWRKRFETNLKSTERQTARVLSRLSQQLTRMSGKKSAAPGRRKARRKTRAVAPRAAKR